MSFVREIIQSNALLTMDKLGSDLPELHNLSLSLKTSLLRYVEDTYIKFLERPQNVSLYKVKIEELTKRANDLQTNIDEMVKVEINTTKTEIGKFKENLHRVDTNLQICYDINRRIEQLHEAQIHIEKKSYIKAADIFKDLESIDTEKYGNIMLKLQENAKQAQCMFIHVTLKEIIDKNIKYEMNEDGDIITHSLVFQPRNNDMEEAIIAYAIMENNKLDIFDDLNNKIEKMFECILKFSCQLQFLLNECTLQFNNQNSMGTKDNYEVVFSNLVKFSKFLESNYNYHINDKTTLLNYLKNYLNENLSKDIVTHCLEETIPNNNEALQNYVQVQQNTENLQTTLIEIGILDESNTRLTDFTFEINKHFVNKKCKRYKIHALNIMKSDLHNTIIVGKPYDPNDMSFDGFPQCAISKSVVELLDLLKQILQKVNVPIDEASGTYVSLTIEILNLYEKQEHHKKLLMTIPQQMAIFYNNCKYLNYELCEPKWINELLSQLSQNVMCAFTIAKQQLNDTAVQMLESLTSEQVGNIKERIDTSGIQSACDKLEPTVEKAVRQCLRQQELLKTIWQKVLNYYDYNKVMGLLLDALCKSLISNIMNIKDIPSDVADELGDILKLILVRGPKLFTEPKEIHMYAIHWDKLNELILVLNSNLNLIGERWADGKGPLALHFTAPETRSLVRALFQNSDERAYLLSTIK